MTTKTLILAVLAIGVLAAATLAMMSGTTSASIMMAGVLVAVLCFLAAKTQGTQRQAENFGQLQSAYEQLDRQAKLIIRTDLELHRAQEELDRRLASLMALHELGRQLQVSLHPDEVFTKLEATTVTQFGFSTGLLGRCPTLQTIEWKSLVGVNESAGTALKAILEEPGVLEELVTAGHPILLDASLPKGSPKQRLLQRLGVPQAVIAGILPHAGPAGCLVLSRTGPRGEGKADEELVAILANQLAIAIENSALFEQAWSATHELERKVQDRTRELADANAQLMRLNKAKSDFVSAVSHELRTPLAAIKGYASLLGSGQFGALAKPQAERIAKIEKHADLLTQFINNLLDIARIESGRVTMERKLIPVAEFFGSIAEQIQPQLDAKRLRYTLNADGVPSLLGDPQHLSRVFVNFLSNAIKYTPEGGEIRIGLRRDRDTVIATVSDTGCGIPAEDVPKLFQEFFRANDPINQEVRGTGLGLALVKRIIEAHHGQVRVESDKGRGTTFTITLPLTEASA